MDSPLETRLTIGAAIGVVVFSVMAVWHWQRAAAPDAAPAAPAAGTWDGPIGPGLASGAAREFPALGANLQGLPEPGLETDAGGHLVPSLALRKLMDAYLASGQPSGRRAPAEALRTFLKRKLAAPAAGEADYIVTRYLDYLEAEDRFLERERFTAPGSDGVSARDVERLLAFQDQRAQLRQRLLGAALAQTWFEADDSRCGAILHDWQLQHVPPGPGQELDPVEARERRIHGAALEARRDEDAHGCAAQMTRGFGAGG